MVIKRSPSIYIQLSLCSTALMVYDSIRTL